MNSLSTDTREVLTCFLNMNLLFLVLLPVPRRLIPQCTCSVTPAGAVRIYKHSWCTSASRLSDLPSPRTSPHRKTHSLPRKTRLTQIQDAGRFFYQGCRQDRGSCQLIISAQCLHQDSWKFVRVNQLRDHLKSLNGS